MGRGIRATISKAGGRSIGDIQEGRATRATEKVVPRVRRGTDWTTGGEMKAETSGLKDLDG